jgi:DNA-binding NtrC family response regulator
MTGYSNRDRVEAARDHGMTEFLVKPYTARDLYNRIVRLIEKPRQFVKTREFFGPDRRRHKEDEYEGEGKRKKDYYAEKSKELREAADIIMQDSNKAG